MRYLVPVAGRGELIPLDLPIIRFDRTRKHVTTYEENVARFRQLREGLAEMRGYL